MHRFKYISQVSCILLFLGLTSFPAAACKSPEVVYEVSEKGGLLRLNSGSNVILEFSAEKLSLSEEYAEEWEIETPLKVYEDARGLIERITTNVPRHKAVLYPNRLKLKLKPVQEMQEGETREYEVVILADQKPVPIQVVYTAGQRTKARGGCSGASFEAN